MSEAFARATLAVLSIYLAAGLIAAVPLVLSGIGRIDPAAKSAPWTFRALVFPGVVALWPFLVMRYLSARAGRGIRR